MTMPISANGLTGHLMWNGENYQFRVYSSPGVFADYTILHSDLIVTIDDTDAFIYPVSDEKNQDGFIDHSPETMGFFASKQNVEYIDI